MPTVQQIIDFGERFYPKSGLVSIANRVSDLNDLHKDIYITIQRLKNDFKIYELNSIEGIPFYPLPIDCRIDDIIKIMVSIDTLGSKFEEYKYAGLGDEIGTSRYYGRSTEGTFFLFKDSRPLAIVGLKIQIYYYPRPTALSESNLSAIPDLDEDYHDLLKFGFIQMMASQGNNPDTGIADHWQGEYNFKLQKVMNNIEERMNNTPTRRPEMKERM